MELTRDIALYLHGMGLIGDLGQDTFLDTRPEEPDNITSFHDTGGYPAEMAVLDLRRTVQVFVRDRAYKAGRRRIWALFKALDRPGNRIIKTDNRRMFCKAMQPPNFLGRDANNRVLFVFNMEIFTARD